MPQLPPALRRGHRLPCAFVLWLAMASGVAQASRVPAQPEMEVSPWPAPARTWREGHALHYRGAMDASAIDTVRVALSDDPAITELVIDSPGGDVDLGMDLGELLLAHRVDVRVVGTGCISSCANYVFIAGRSKVIEPGAVVAWHGSALQESGWAELELDMESQARDQLGRAPSFVERWQMKRIVRRWRRDWQRRQASLYAQVGVDERITVFGQQVECGCTWFLSTSDMAAFGLVGVHAPADYGQASLPDPYGGEWRLLRLEDHPDYPLARAHENA